MSEIRTLGRRAFLAVASAAVWSAAACAPRTTVLQPITFSGMSPIRLAVGRVDVADGYIAPGRLPNVEHLMRETPAAAMRRWTVERLQVTGGPGIARFTIEDASLIQEDLPRTTGLQGLFTVDQTQRLTLSLAARIEAFGAPGRSDAFARVRATRTVTVPETADAGERQAIQHRMLAQGMADLNDQLDRNIRQYLGGWIAY